MTRRSLLTSALASPVLLTADDESPVAMLPVSGPDQGVLWLEDNNLGRSGGMTPDLVEMFIGRAAEWAATRDYLGVYMLRLNTLREQATVLTDRFLADHFLPALRGWSIDLALNGVGATWAQCHSDKKGIVQELLQVERIVRLGGRVRYFSLQSPLSKPSRRCGEYGRDAGYCLRIDDVVRSVALVNERYPEIGVGMLDALPAKGWEYQSVYQRLIDALGQHGLGLAYLHLDFPKEFAAAGWTNALAAEAFIRQQLGLRFGLTYTTRDGGRTSNAAFHQGVLAAYQEYRTAGGRPDDLLLMSWYPHPTHGLPEDATTDYPLLRTALELARLGGVTRRTSSSVRSATRW